MIIASSWKEADALRLTRYYGKPCSKCGGTIRARASKHCVACDKPRAQQARLKWMETERGKELMRQFRKRKKTRYYRTEKGKAQRTRLWRRQRLRPEVRIARALRDRLAKSVKRNTRAGSAVSDLGCSIAEFRIHIESQFLPDWDWTKKSWGPMWHLDHIKPLATFDLTDRSQILEACHWSNLRPYPAKLNVLEGDRRNLK